jgi:hypothetical protein
MKVDIPDNLLQGQTLYILDGIEMVAYKSPGCNWFVKTSRCLQCGICCTKLSPAVNTFYSKQAVNGRCIHLISMEDGRQLCGLGIERPFACTVTTDMKEENPNCPVSFKEFK